MRSSKLRLVFVVFCLGLVLSPAVCSAQVYIIDFDKDPSGNVIPAGFALEHVFARLGLRFSHVGPTSGSCDGVYANPNRPEGFGTSNLISVCPGASAAEMSEDDTGLVQIKTDWDLAGACIDAHPGGVSQSAVIRGYDHGGDLIDEHVSAPGATETICVSGERIRRIHFSGHGDSFAWFDRLRLSGSDDVTEAQYLPGAANLDGYGGAKWRTDLEIQNPDFTDATFWLENLPRDQTNLNPTKVEFTLPAGQSRRFVNVLGDVFNYTGASTIRVTSSQSLIATARSYNDAADGTYGQFIRGRTVSEAIGPGRTGRLIQLTQSTSDTVGYRSNIGLANLSGFRIRVNIELFNSSGISLGSVMATLEAYESVQHDKIFRRVTSEEIIGGYAIVSSSSPQATYLAFATPIDNRTGDGFYFPAIDWW